MQGLTNTRKLYTTAVVISPPQGHWAPIQALRKQYDKAYNRWYVNGKSSVYVFRMPHINLIFPFIAPDQFATAAHILSEALSGFAPFEVKLDSFKSFNHGNSSSTEKIIELQAAIVKAFPFCDDQNKKSDAGFTPHLTVGQWNTRGVEQKKKEFTDSTLSQIKTFQVTHIDFISRNGDVPFEVHYQVSLGGGVKKITGSTHESASNDKDRRVFVGGIEKDVKSEDLKNIFVAKGFSVEKATVPLGKPFGFVTFATAEDQQRALKEVFVGLNIKPANS